MDTLTPLTLNFTILVVAATILVILAKKTKEPPIIAYIFTGVILGPVFLNMVTETASIELFSELGLGFLLFLLGLEMKIGSIRKILKPIIKIALLQTVLQTALAFIIAFALGFNLVETTIIALCTVFGATPVIVKVLADQNKINTLSGKLDVGVLIIQDIILVIYLAIFSSGALTSPTGIGISLDPAQTGFTLLRVFFMVGVISVITFILSRYMLSGVLEKIAKNKHAFFIHGITWAFGFIALGHLLGLSIEIGGFLAGLGLGQLPYHQELKEKVTPLTTFFLVIFFASIGLRLTPGNLLAYWKEALFSGFLLMAGNFAIMFYLIDREKFTPRTSFLGSINMTQVSEFSLVVGGIAISQGFIKPDLLGYFSLMALVTMTLSTYLITYNERIYEKLKPLFKRFESEDKKDVELETLEDHALLIGYNDITKKLMPVIEDNFDQIAIVDKNPENVNELQEMDVEYVFGSFNHEEIQKSVKLQDANLIISFGEGKGINNKILETCKTEATVFLETKDPAEEAEYYSLGATYVIRPNLLTAEKMREYLQISLKDPSGFKKEIEKDRESLSWVGKDGGKK